MGQDQSKSIESPEPNPKREESEPESGSESESSSPPSMESLLAEAAAFGNEDESLSMEAKAQKALECPCIQNLRSGPCGSQFSDAFLCFLKSTAEEKGSDCVIPFVALQRCIKTNPNAFPKDVLENDEVEKEKKPVEDYKIIPPRWSMEPSRPKNKL
ncbi:mitochondrial intermembrane space import and assembly protein 40 homolog [Lactuca sativa]|uniref:mitochondrial intermembrane space import and assembly protein 40 homolog n=1 Tax=Lactuca sativa TaxID=4236 RepID=UPI000CA6DB60|nr:mitochondrial intermembrane space import and assembly protein 40 homolog [Lactuca sativa]